ncbi:unnamed protein product [Camellia sinensis]
MIHGLNRHYYSIAINYRKNELEEKMLLNLHKKKWTDGLTLQRFDTHSKTNEQTVQVSEAFCEAKSFIVLCVCCIWHLCIKVQRLHIFCFFNLNFERFLSWIVVLPFVPESQGP